MIGFLRKSRIEPIVMDAKSQDASTIASLHGEAFARGWSDGEFQNLINDDHVIGLIARDVKSQPSRPIGFMLVRWVLDEAEILTIAVSKNAQRGGIGFALVDEALRRLHGMRVAALFLEVEEGNQPAIGLYRKMGFKKVGQRDNYYGKTEAASDQKPKAALVMRRDLR